MERTVEVVRFVSVINNDESASLEDGRCGLHPFLDSKIDFSDLSFSKFDT